MPADKEDDRHEYYDVPLHSDGQGNDILTCDEQDAFSKLETVSIAEPLQNRQHAPLMLSTLGSKEKREGG